MASKSSLKTPKGTRDWVGAELLLRDHIFKTISTVFERHGGVPLDTPVFELRNILTDKYGEDSKLIYDLADQGGEACSLRYDLTVPFARWLSSQSNLQHIKRYQIAKVYRRDQPAIARGRLREFYQCDFDIAGLFDPMIPDAEVLVIIAEVFEALKIGITVKLNHRKILDGMFAVAGVPTDKLRTTSSAVDKLDKAPWDEVRKELLDKGLSEEVADRVGGYVQQKGSMREMLDKLEADADLTANKTLAEGIADMRLLASYLEAMGVVDQISFDLSLARGLDYYTGLIYEVIVVKDAVKVGSVAAGGRYDDLVGMYGRRPLPCIGISFGVDRIFTILDARREKKKAGLDLGVHAEVYIMAFGGKEFDGLLLERMKVARQLWDAGIRAEFAAKVKPKPQQQTNASKGVPITIILGQDEVEAGQVRLKRFRVEEKSTNEQVGDKTATEKDGAETTAEKEKDKGRLVARKELVEEVRKLLASSTIQ